MVKNEGRLSQMTGTRALGYIIARLAKMQLLTELLREEPECLNKWTNKQTLSGNKVKYYILKLSICAKT